MQRLLKLNTWKVRGNDAAEASLLVAVAALVVPLILFVGVSWLAYDETRQQAEERISRTLDLLYGSVRTTFETEYLVAANVRELIEDHSNAEITAGEQKIHDQLRRLVEKLPQVDNIYVLDDGGEAIVSAKIFPLPKDAKYADRAYFAAHRDAKVQRYVSEPLHGRLRDRDFFQYSERRQKVDGSFNGVIAVSILPSYFIGQFSRASDIPNFTASIIRADGVILARFPDTGPGVLGPDTGFTQATRGAPAEGTYKVEQGAIDGYERIFIYRKLPDLPIYVVHGFSTEAIRQTWISRMSSHLIFGLPATVGLFILALVATRRAMQESDALSRLRQEQVRREAAEESLQQSQKMTAVGQLTAGIAHDFNNLLTGIGGALELVGRRLAHPSPEVVRFLDLARSGVTRAATLTQRLLAFSRQQPLQIEAIDANKLVSGMSELLRHTLGEKVRIETVLAGGLWLAKADLSQLESAVLNLAINGRDAMPGGGTLTIETANAHLDDAYAAANVEVASGQYVLIAVSDTGAGMDQEMIARAFEPFFTTKQRGQGTGLGLSMTFGYIKQVGGHLKIYSEVGHGTTVKLYLPRATSELDQVVESAAQAPSASGSGPVVLVVEDDPVVREFAISACREIGCTVYHAENGAQAIAILEAHDDIVLLFTDIGLPGAMNGRQLADVATGRWSRLSVLYTTGYTANAIVHHGVLDPGVNFIGKPFSIAALSAKIKSMGF
jgi:signal transduction histidine kinase